MKTDHSLKLIFSLNTKTNCIVCHFFGISFKNSKNRTNFKKIRLDSWLEKIHVLIFHQYLRENPANMPRVYLSKIFFGQILYLELAAKVWSHYFMIFFTTHLQLDPGTISVEKNWIKTVVSRHLRVLLVLIL